VELGEDNFAEPPTNRDFTEKPLRLILVGSLAQLYKAPDILLKAMHSCIESGLDLHLTVVGEGMYRSQLEALASDLGMANRVVFVGQLLAGTPVRQQLDKAHLFVLASRVEGLPRAMIEAMARGLPCIGSSVGGIPELLPSECLVRPGDVRDLAIKIKAVARDPVRLKAMAARNLGVARQYQEHFLRLPRLEFYRFLRTRAVQQPL
jgi:glycosyltransferase involved in cell wall biosynthesis